MRAVALPLSLLFAFFLYPVFPSFSVLLTRGLRALFARVLRLFTRKSGHADSRPAICVLLLLLGGAAALLGAVHPLLGAVAAAPVFTGLALLPGCARAKDELDSGAYAKDREGYETLVRDTCLPLGPAFAADVCTPLLLGALGTPLYLGVSLCWCYAALRALCDTDADARRICTLLLRPADAALRFLLTLLAPLFGRSLLHARGRRSGERLMYILGIAGDERDTHPPMAGDITQAVFLCCFAALLLTGALTFTLMVIL